MFIPLTQSRPEPTIETMSIAIAKPAADLFVESDEQAVIASFLAGQPIDPEVARRVHERAQAIRTRVFEEHGLLDIGVPAIRELRGELSDKADAYEGKQSL
jgi:hypothetical protein